MYTRENALRYQKIDDPDGLILHAGAPLKIIQREWTRYMRSSSIKNLALVLYIYGVWFRVSGDSCSAGSTGL